MKLKLPLAFQLKTEWRFLSGRIEPFKGIEYPDLRDGRDQAKIVLSWNVPHYLVVIGGDPEGCEEDDSIEMQRLQNLCKRVGIG